MADLGVVQLLVIFLALFIGAKLTIGRAQESAAEKANGCGTLPRYPQKDPLLGLDIVLAQIRAVRAHRFLEWLEKLYWNAPKSAKTFSINVLGSRQIYTIDPTNIKALLSGQFGQFLIAPLRRNAALLPFADQGISLSDGEEWEHTQALSKAFFFRDNYANIDRLKPFTDSLFEILPEDGVTFDIHPLMHRWVHDANSAIIFGESVGCLKLKEQIPLITAMTDIQRGARIRLVFSKLLWAMPDRLFKWWFDAIKVVHQYIDGHIERTYREMAERKKAEEAGLELGPERTDLLWSMAQNLPDDAVALRSNIALIFAPNSDAITVYITNSLWQVARRPDVWEKVRAEVLAIGDAPLTFTALRNMKYLVAVLNESQRLMVTSLAHSRSAGVDTTLPTGGGPDGKLPILIRKGDIIHAHRNALFKDKDLWGEDAEEFRPERWEQQRKPFWSFIPFGGGPRRCPAEMLVVAQASYVVARLAQQYRRIESRDPEPYVPMMRITPVNKNGVKIALFK